MVGTLTYGADTIRYEVCFLASRRTLGIEVHPDSRVLVRAPLGCSPALIAQKIQKRARWISRQLADFERYRPRTPARQYVSGESHLYLGRQYRLKLVAGCTAGVRLSRSRLLVGLAGQPDSELVRSLLHRWYLDRARIVFAEELEASMHHFKGAHAPLLSVRTMKSRWGSLSRAGTMTLNVNLVRASRSCIRYVITHELCHLRHRDHDPKFFKLLGQVMPDWGRWKQQLESALL